MREALSALEEEGLISRRAGRGSFVLRRPDLAGDRRLTLREECQRVEATAAETGLARLLDVTLAAPLPQVTRLLRGASPAGRHAPNVFVLFRSQFRADRYYYTVDLSSRPTPRRAKPRQPTPPPAAR